MVLEERHVTLNEFEICIRQGVGIVVGFIFEEGKCVRCSKCKIALNYDIQLVSNDPIVFLVRRFLFCK